MKIPEQVETENYAGHYIICDPDGVSSRYKQCNVELQQSGGHCSILLRDLSGVLFCVIDCVERSNSRKEPEGALHWDQSIPDDKTRHC